MFQRMTPMLGVCIIGRPLRSEGRAMFWRACRRQYFGANFRNGRFGGERVAHQLTSVGTERTERETLGPASRADSVTSHHLIQAKLKPPRSATTCIDRPALLLRLAAAARFTLLTAPI